jgi:hypothetical protein
MDILCLWTTIKAVLPNDLKNCLSSSSESATEAVLARALPSEPLVKIPTNTWGLHSHNESFFFLR